jgi:integrase/recombinase XerD
VLLSDALTEFLLSCESEGLQEKTTRWYSEKLSRLVAAMGNDCQIEQVGAMDIRRFLVSLRDSGISGETVRGYDRALRRFFNWSILEYEIDPATNPMTRIRKPLKPEPAPDPMRFSEFVKMLELCDQSQIGIRNRAILLFLADTGARSGGLRGLRPRDIETERLRAVVNEKRDRARYVYLLPLTAAALQSWLDVRPQSSKFVFCSLSVRSVGAPLTAEALHRIITKLGQRAGVVGPDNPHAVRKMFAIENLEAGNDVFTVSSLLGHSDLKTTEYYARFAEAQRQRRHDMFSPVRLLETQNERR